MGANKEGMSSAMGTFRFPVKGFCRQTDPYARKDGPYKVRFFVEAKNIPAGLAGWMSTNPREQNLESKVATAIAISLLQDSQDFHLKNRGCLFSAEKVSFAPVDDAGNGFVKMSFSSPALHGNIDGGHTLRLILAAVATGDVPEQYVEFEVIVGVRDILDIAEARNTSVALDMRTLEGMKGSYDVLREILGDLQLPGGDRFFNRVEMKMNEQLEEKNAIDIRQLISILLMFNKELYPTAGKDGKPLSMVEHPVQMYGGKEAALKKYLELGGGGEGRDRELRAMEPVFPGIIRLWDIVEKELPLVNQKKYGKYFTSTSRRQPRSLFSNEPIAYHVPQSILFPIVAAFRCLVDVGEDGSYCWVDDPIEIWEECKGRLVESLLAYLTQYRIMSAYTASVRRAGMWQTYYLTVLVTATARVKEKEMAERWKD